MRIFLEVGASIHAEVKDSDEQFNPEITERFAEIVGDLMDEIRAGRESTPNQLARKHIALTADDATLLSMQSFFPAWAVAQNYKKGDIMTFNGDLWRVLQDHRSQADWIPPDAVSLYVRITPPGEVGPWRQPQGAHDAYQVGDKVTHQDKTWISTAKDNVWEPGVFGWDLT